MGGSDRAGQVARLARRWSTSAIIQLQRFEDAVFVGDSREAYESALELKRCSSQLADIALRLESKAADWAKDSSS